MRCGSLTWLRPRPSTTTEAATGSKRGTAPGLTAGGTGEDWIGWYRDRINTWDRRHDTIYGAKLIESGRELARLDDGNTATLDQSPAAAGGWIRIPMQTLPDYWQHHAP